MAKPGGGSMTAAEKEAEQQKFQKQLKAGNHTMNQCLFQPL